MSGVDMYVYLKRTLWKVLTSPLWPLFEMI